MRDHGATYVTSEQLLFLSPWRPVDTDTSPSEGGVWTCLNCAGEISYFRSLARLEGSDGEFMVQCPSCDHLHVLYIDDQDPLQLEIRFGGPHIDRFLALLDRRNADET